MIICYTFPEIWRQVSDVIAIFHFGQFLALSLPLPPPAPPTAQKMKIKKKMKKKTKKRTRGGINIDHNCTKNHDHVLYCSWDMVCDWCNCYFSFWAIFCLFTPSPQRPKKWKFQNNGKTPGYIIILNRCTEKHGHILNCSWHIMHDGCSCYFSFWAIFCSPPPPPPTPPPPETAWKMKVWKKKWKQKRKKKLLEISFYTSVPKIMIICCTVPEIWCVT